MKRRVRRKETIGNASQCLTRSKEGDENDPFYRIPLDLKIEILLKLPAKSIAKLMFVSKSWSSIIHGKDFTDMYQTRSSTRPRLLFKVDRRDMHMHFFHSCSQEDPSSDHHRVSYTLNSDDWYYFSPPTYGLICCLNDTKVMIGNPSTGQFVTLPRVKTWKRGIFSFFGYDPINDEYKVLCMTVACYFRRGSRSIVSGEHQVLTLGAKQKWRMIECKHPHYPPPRTKGICNNGAVYYLAWIYHLRSLICFDLRSENFNVIKLPGPGDVQNLVNYSGKIALLNLLFDGTLDLSVLEDASKQEWSKVSILVPSWRDLVGYQAFRFRGTLSTGELIFAPCFSSNDPFFLLFYNPKENIARKVLIEGIGYDNASIEVFLDHVETPMNLSKVR